MELCRTLPEIAQGFSADLQPDATLCTVPSFQEVPAGLSAGTTESPSPGQRNQRRRGARAADVQSTLRQAEKLSGNVDPLLSRAVFALCVAWALATPFSGRAG